MATYRLHVRSRITGECQEANNPLPSLPLVVESASLPMLTDDQRREAEIYQPYWTYYYSTHAAG